MTLNNVESTNYGKNTLQSDQKQKKSNDIQCMYIHKQTLYIHELLTIIL